MEKIRKRDHLKFIKREHEKKNYADWSVFNSHADRRKKYEKLYYNNPKYNYRNSMER